MKCKECGKDHDRDAVEIAEAYFDTTEKLVAMGHDEMADHVRVLLSAASAIAVKHDMKMSAVVTYFIERLNMRLPKEEQIRVVEDVIDSGHLN